MLRPLCCPLDFSPTMQREDQSLTYPVAQSSIYRFRILEDQFHSIHNSLSDIMLTPTLFQLNFVWTVSSNRVEVSETKQEFWGYGQALKDECCVVVIFAITRSGEPVHVASSAHICSWVSETRVPFEQ